jgi:hypothetical protein
VRVLTEDRGALSVFFVVAVDLTHFEVYRVVGKGAFGKVQAVRHKLSGERASIVALAAPSVAAVALTR